MSKGSHVPAPKLEDLIKHFGEEKVAQLAWDYLIHEQSLQYNIELHAENLRLPYPQKIVELDSRMQRIKEMIESHSK